MVVTNSSPWYRWPIEIDGLPNLKMGGSFHGKLLNSQMVDILDTHSKKKVHVQLDGRYFPMCHGAQGTSTDSKTCRGVHLAVGTSRFEPHISFTNLFKLPFGSSRLVTTQTGLYPIY